MFLECLRVVRLKDIGNVGNFLFSIDLCFIFVRTIAFCDFSNFTTPLNLDVSLIGVDLLKWA